MNAIKTRDYLKTLNSPKYATPLAIFLAFFGIFYNGYQYAVQDHFVQIPIMLHMDNPALYPHDIVISQKAYLSFFWIGFGFLAHYFTPWVLAFVIYMIASIFYFRILYSIGHKVIGSSTGGYIFVLLMFVPKPGLGYAMMSFDIWMSLKVISTPLVLLGLYNTLEGNYQKSAAAVGISFYLHPISAVTSGFLIACTQFYLQRQKDFGDRIKQLLKTAGVFFILASYAIYDIVTLPNSSFSATKQWLLIMELRSGSMLFPREFYFWVWLIFALYAILIYICYRDMEKPYDEILAVWLTGIVILFAINYFFSQVIPTPFVMKIQLNRGLRFLPLISYLYVTKSLLKIDYKQKLNPRESFIAISAIFSLFSEIAFIPVLILALVYLIALWRNNIQKFEIDIQVWRTDKKKKRKFIGILILALLLHIIAGYGLNGVPFGDLDVRTSQKPEWVATQTWVKDHTPIDAILITPPQIYGFRVYSQRTVVGEWRDGTLAFFNRTFGIDWWQRMEDLGMNEKNYLTYNNNNYLALNFTVIALKYHASYFVTFTNNNLNLSLYNRVYENSVYSVYQT